MQGVPSISRPKNMSKKHELSYLLAELSNERAELQVFIAELIVILLTGIY